MAPDAAGAADWTPWTGWLAATPPLARLHAVLSLLLWLGVIACGRLLAYV
jgi:hypothetical protein